MDERVKQLKTPEACERFIANVIKKYPDLAQEARRRKVELLAFEHGGAMNEAEIEALQAIYAYEEVLTVRNKRKTRASRTWQMVKRHGIIGAVERAVNRRGETLGFTALVEMGMQDLSFEAIVIRYPDLFSQEAVARSKQRLNEWTHTTKERVGVKKSQLTEVLAKAENITLKKEGFRKPPEDWTSEDFLIIKYLNEVGGIIFAEVIVGQGGVHKWPTGSKPRRIDAVRIPKSAHKEIVTFKKVNGEKFKQLVTGERVEVIEAKRNLNRLAIGQSIVGTDLLDLDYQPYCIKQVILCEVGDPLLEMICERRGIKVWKSGD